MKLINLSEYLVTPTDPKIHILRNLVTDIAIEFSKLTLPIIEFTYGGDYFAFTDIAEGLSWIMAALMILCYHANISPKQVVDNAYNKLRKSGFSK